MEGRARLEDEKLEQEEMQRNRDIKEIERLLKNQNGELTKKEIAKMEKKLEKAQQQAARVAMLREQNERKENERLKQEKEDAVKRAKEKEMDAVWQKERDEKKKRI